MSIAEASTSHGKRKRDVDADGGDDEYLPYDEAIEDNDSGFMDDEDEPYTFGSQALPVARLSNTFNGIPQDGMEYLFTVRREERKLPIVTRVLNPYSTEETVSSTSKGKGIAVTTFENSIPSEHWRSCFEQRFRNMRQNMRQKTISVAFPNQSLVKLPGLVDRDRWWAFFRGDANWEAVPQSKHHAKGSKKRKGKGVDYDDPLPDNGERMRGWVVCEEKLSWDDSQEFTMEIRQPENQSQMEKMEASPEEVGGSLVVQEERPAELRGPREPTPWILSSLDQKTIFQLLKFFTSWIQAHFDRTIVADPPPHPDAPEMNTRLRYEFTPHHSHWIFGLLAWLDDHLSSDEISVLRTLAREAMQLIKEERSNSKNEVIEITQMGETGCWMIIAAITGVWGQKDLWTDAVDILR